MHAFQIITRRGEQHTHRLHHNIERHNLPCIELWWPYYHLLRTSKYIPIQTALPTAKTHRYLAILLRATLTGEHLIMAPRYAATFRFRDLPSEIRNQIYRELLCGFKSRPTTADPSAMLGFVPARHDIDTGILRTNKSIYREAYDVLIKTNRFVKVRSSMYELNVRHTLTSYLHLCRSLQCAGCQYGSFSTACRFPL